MSRMVRAAIVQTDWTGDKESMIDAHEKYFREAAAEGTQVMCFQERLDRDTTVHVLVSSRRLSLPKSWPTAVSTTCTWTVVSRSSLS